MALLAFLRGSLRKEMTQSTAGYKSFGGAPGSCHEEDTPCSAFTRDWGTLRPSLSD